LRAAFRARVYLKGKTSEGIAAPEKKIDRAVMPRLQANA
jgi:hypothetical protein